MRLFCVVAPFPKNEQQYVETSRTLDIYPGGEHQQMLPKTRQALKAFYYRFNQRLASLTDDDVFLLWNQPDFDEPWRVTQKPEVLRRSEI